MVNGEANVVKGCLLGDVVAIRRRHVRQRRCAYAGEADVMDKGDIDAKPPPAEHRTGGWTRSDD